MIIKTQTILVTVALLLIFSCKPNQEQRPLSFPPRVVEAHGYVVPKDSMAEPKVIPAGKPRIVRAGKPKVALTNTNVHPAGIPRVVIAGVPRVCTPGQDSFSLPKTVLAVDSPFMAGIPEVVNTRDQPPSQNFSSFRKLQGLKSDVIGCLIEDKRGNLSFGPGGSGVSKYDGKSFTHFTVKEGLSNNYIRSMREDKSGNLWVGTDGLGVSKYDGESFTHFTVKEGLSDNNVLSIYEDKRGILWFGTAGGVSRYDGKSFTHFTVKEGLSNNNVLSIYEDKSGILWFGTGGGVNKYDSKSFTHFTVKEGLSNNVVTSIQEDKSGNLWFGTEGGVNKYDSNSFTHFTDKEGMSNNAVTSILKDKRGNLWFGTAGGGVSKFGGNSFTHFTVKEGVSSILEDKRGNLWFGTGGGGVSKYNGNSFTHFTAKEGLIGNMVLSMLEDKSGKLWFGNYGGGLSEYDGKSKSFTHLTQKEGLSDNLVQSLREDKSGNLWVGSLSGGVSKYDGKSFTHFTEKEGLSDNSVNSIIEDKSGNLWFGTDNGLSKLEKNSLATFDKAKADEAVSGLIKSGPLFKTYTSEDGCSGGGSAMCEAKDGTIWIASGGLTAFHPGEENPDTIAPNIQLTGLTLFNENIGWQNLLSPLKGDGRRADNYREWIKDTSIVLGNGVKVHDFHFDCVSRWYGVPEHLSLAYNNNYLTFQFVGITLQSPKKVKYQYKLEGLDNNWSALTDRSEATYGNLPHGKYTFKVKAMNGEGYWSNEFNYSFTSRPPWWETSWAYVLYVMLLAVGIWSIVYYRLKSLRRELEQRKKEQQLTELKQQKTELEMQALRAQMNPHFIFNSLNSINMFILENNKLQASEYLSKFSRLVRLILQNSKEAFIPLEKELEALLLYLELESLRFDNKFEYKISVDDEVDTTMLKVPPLIIQPYVENAIWHGLMHKKEKRHLDIQLFLEKEVLFCKITDDGIGRKKAAELKSKSASTHKSMGMRITGDRIAMLQQQKQNGTSISITDLVLRSEEHTSEL